MKNRANNQATDSNNGGESAPMRMSLVGNNDPNM